MPSHVWDWNHRMNLKEAQSLSGGSAIGLQPEKDSQCAYATLYTTAMPIKIPAGVKTSSAWRMRDFAFPGLP